MRAFVLSLLAIAAFLPVQPASAQTVIHHCVAANGTPIFTDRACTSLQAAAIAPARAATAAAVGSSIAAPLIATGCAADIRELKGRIVRAFANHDANALAGLMLWQDQSGSAARIDMQSLASLVQQPLLGIDDGSKPQTRPATEGATRDPWPGNAPWDAPQPEAVPPQAGTPPTDLNLRLGADALVNPQQIRFTVRQAAECLWLSP